MNAIVATGFFSRIGDKQPRMTDSNSFFWEKWMQDMTLKGNNNAMFWGAHECGVE
ncbi:MAG: hypothetical protein ABI171_04850 [Collimonas sp.]|uniref:hypothetical protein n=1 Tax=Collimonas sp. TaxID=1963772 RepID=UPI0032630633